MYLLEVLYLHVFVFVFISNIYLKTKDRKDS